MPALDERTYEMFGDRILGSLDIMPYGVDIFCRLVRKGGWSAEAKKAYEFLSEEERSEAKARMEMPLFRHAFDGLPNRGDV